MVIGVDGSRAFIRNRTGTENYSYQLLKALAKIDRKNNYMVYLRPGGDTSDFQNSVRSYNEMENFEFKVLDYSRLWTQIGLSCQTFQDKLDVLFVPAHTLPVVRRPGLKTVVTVHDLGSEFLPKTHQIKQRLYLSFVQKKQLKGATKLIAVSQATKEDLVKKIGINPKKIEVIYEGFDKSLFKPMKNLSRAKSRDDLLINSLKQFGLKPGTYFLFVGTIQPRKNLERLIKAYAGYLRVAARLAAKHHSPDQIACYGIVSRQPFARETAPIALTGSDFAAPPLILVGGKGWLSDEIYELPKKLGIEKQVKFLGRVDDKDLPALYCGALALVFPSLFEGFGLPILEAQACGCPVITSNVSSMPEVAGKGAIYVDPYSVDDIVKGMERIQVTGYRLQLIKKGFENIKRFSWEKCARETLALLEGIDS